VEMRSSETVTLCLIFPRSGGHLSKLDMIRAEVMDGEHSTGIHGRRVVVCTDVPYCLLKIHLTRRNGGYPWTD